MSAAIEFQDVVRRYGQVKAVDAVSLSVESGEFFAMLGPSGSGKTTCLRLIAGFEAPDAGRVLLDGVDVTTTPPSERDVNTVFQDYALFPHMSVLENVAYGLRVRGVALAERRQRAMAALDMVKLAQLAQRRPAQLSGGQRQRVALARALVNRPRVLLLDEPLGALDLKLREAMQLELRTLQRQLGITFVFVTHDQGEALSMADRVAVFNSGRIEQLAAPRELYTRPATAFVARFVGGANVAEGELARRLSGSDEPFAVRGEHVELLMDGQELSGDAMGSSARVMDVQYHGAQSRWQLQLPDGTLFSAVRDSDGTHAWPVGAQVRIGWQRRHAVVLNDPDASHG
ncbi:MAG: ABC transporter ATP-binding protein [Steroidobacteraceae bacterium]